MSSDEKSLTSSNGGSWEEEAARFLVRSGYRPGDRIGEIQHMANPHQVGRTFGSVGRAMRTFVDPDGESAKAPDQKGAPPAETMRLLFGACTIGAMPEGFSRTSLRPKH